MKVVRNPEADDAEQYDGTNVANLNALLDGVPMSLQTIDGTLTLMGTTVDPPMPITPVNATDWLVRTHATGAVYHYTHATFVNTYTETATLGAGDTR